MKSMTGSRVEARRARRRRQYLRVARRLFVSRGFDATTMEQVSSAAGYSKRTVYLYFESKNELFSAVLHPELLALQARLDRRRPGDGRTQLIAMARAYIDFSRERPDVFSLLMRFELHEFYRDRDRSSVGPNMAACLEINEQLSRRVDEVISLGLADGSIESSRTPAQLNLIIWAGLVGLMQICRQRQAMLRSHYKASAPQLLEEFITRILPPIRRPPRGAS